MAAPSRVNEGGAPNTLMADRLGFGDWIEWIRGDAVGGVETKRAKKIKKKGVFFRFLL